MTRLSRQRWRSGPALLGLFFCALVLRTFVPAGYMIGPAAAGSPALILCPDAGPIPQSHGKHHHGHPATHKESPCPYAALAAPALPPAPVLLAPQPLPRAAPAMFAALAASAPPLAAPPPPSTGPPALV